MLDDDGRPEKECRGTEDGSVLNREMKDGRTRVKEDLSDNTNGTHFAC